MARLIRGQILSIKNNEYVLAARCIGTKNSQNPDADIFCRTVCPLSLLRQHLQVPSAIFTESYLKFPWPWCICTAYFPGKSGKRCAEPAMQSYPLTDLVIPAVADLPDRTGIEPYWVMDLRDAFRLETELRR